jgi:hypothetical protein
MQKSSFSSKFRDFLIESKYSSTEINWVDFFSEQTDVKLEHHKVGWMTDLMITFVERALLKTDPSFGRTTLKYVANIIVNQKDFKKKNTFQFFPRYIGSYEYALFQNFIFQVTFVDKTIERVCILLIQKSRSGLIDDLYVFFPFSSYYKTQPDIDNVINDILTYIRQEWNTSNRRSLLVHDHFNFPLTLESSNVYSIYFVCLMQKYSFESIRMFFQNTDILLLTRQKAISMYKNIGVFISQCVQGVSSTGNSEAAKAYIEYMSKDSKKSLSMNTANFNLLRKWFVQCNLLQSSFFDDMIPQVPSDKKKLNIQDMMKGHPFEARMKRFLPSKNKISLQLELYI